MGSTEEQQKSTYSSWSSWNCKTFFSPAINHKYLVGFTEFHYWSLDNDNFKFCSNPSYCSINRHSAQAWYGWANFLYLDKDGKEYIYPAQSLCILSLSDQQARHLPRGDHTGGMYAVVQSLIDVPEQSINCLLLSMKLLTINSMCIVAPVSMGLLLLCPSKMLHRETIFLLSRTRNIGWVAFTIYWNRVILMPSRRIYRFLPRL